MDDGDHTQRGEVWREAASRFGEHGNQNTDEAEGAELRNTPASSTEPTVGAAE
jgi:hypothetical protein